MLYIDADGCPVKDEAYRVADRYGLEVKVVANAWLRLPDSPRIERVIVEDGLDRADDWIAGAIAEGDVLVTADLPLAGRAIKKGAVVVTPDGRRLTEATIGERLATRNLMTELRETGAIKGGGRPFTKKDRSAFLQALDAAIQGQRRVARS